MQLIRPNVFFCSAKNVRVVNLHLFVLAHLRFLFCVPINLLMSSPYSASLLRINERIFYVQIAKWAKMVQKKFYNILWFGNANWAREGGNGQKGKFKGREEKGRREWKLLVKECLDKVNWGNSKK